MGGARESLVKITKKYLKKALKDGTVTEESLNACLVKNYVLALTSDTNDPVHLQLLIFNLFLMDQPSSNENVTITTEKDINSCTKWKVMLAIGNIFWKK